MPDHAEKADAAQHLPRIGEPLVEPHRPPPGSASARFLAWLEGHESLLQHVLHRLVGAFSLDAGFCWVNYRHPEYGPSSGSVALALGPVMNERFPSEPRQRRRAQMISVPHSVMGDLPERWARCETSLLWTHKLGKEFDLHFDPLMVEWALCVPLLYTDEWFGVLGVASMKSTPPSELVVSATEAAARAVSSAFASDVALDGLDEWS